MTGWEVIGFIGTVVAFGSYVASTKYKQLLMFHVGNFVGSVMLGAYEFQTQVWPAFALSILFGSVGLIGMVTSSKEERTKMTEWTVSHAVAMILIPVALTIGLAIFYVATNAGPAKK